MIRIPFILILCIGLCSAARKTTQGTLKIKESKDYPSAVNQQIQVWPALESTQVININNQVINLVVAQPIHACEELTNQPPPQVQDVDIVETYYLIKGGQGQCSYARKVENVKKSFGYGAVIIDSEKGINNLRFRHAERDKIVILLAQQTTALPIADNAKSMVAELHFDEGNSRVEPKKDVEIWLSSLERGGYEVVDWWRQILSEIPELEKKATWMPRFGYFSCAEMQACLNDTQYVASCACGGSFCSPTVHGQSSDVLVREDIRQHQLYKQNHILFLSYMKIFQETCLQRYIQTLSSQQCANGIMDRLGVDYGLISRKIDNFLTHCQDQQDPQIFKTYKQMSNDRNKFKQMNSIPQVIIDRQIISINTKDEFFTTICRTFGLEQTQGCSGFQQTTISIVFSWIVYIIVFLLLIWLGVFIVAFFRNKLRKQMNKELKMQVSTAVQHYFELSDSK